MPRRLTTEEFVEKAIAIHGDRYDYSQVEYVGAKTKVTIICSEHGSFEQTPGSHLYKRGCPDCGGSKQLSTATFINKAKAVHSDRYEYSSVNYVNAHTHVTIICSDHGPFEQTPSNHLSKMNCPECAGTMQLTAETFIEKAKAVHGDRYDYSQVEYVNNKMPVTIICPDHGPFDQAPNNHTFGKGCTVCGAMATAMSRQGTTEEFIDKAKVAHGDRYDYSQVEYVAAKTKVTIICSDHGPFEQTPSNHLFKMGCPDCDPSKKLTTATFIERAKEVHGNRYDYSSINYENAHIKVTIICSDHGPFQQKPTSHLSQESGCPDCADWGFNPNDPALLYYLV